MLYVVVATHGPDTCPAFVEEYKQKVRTASPRMQEMAKGHGVEIKGAWTAMVSHTSFMLVDTQSSHAIQDFISEAELHSWNTVIMYPVEPMQEVLEKIA